MIGKSKAKQITKRFAKNTGHLWMMAINKMDASGWRKLLDLTKICKRKSGKIESLQKESLTFSKSFLAQV